MEHEEMPISFNPKDCFKRKSDRKYISILITSGDSSLIVKVKKGSRMMFGSGEHSFFCKVGMTKKEKIKKKNLSIFRK